MATASIEVELRLKNPRAVAALKVIYETLGEQADRYPFDADLRRAVRAAKYLRKNLTLADVPGGRT
jgi:hypothetical protein